MKIIKKVRKQPGQVEEIYYPEVIPDTIEDLVKNFHNVEEKIRQERNADRRNMELIEAIESLKVGPGIENKAIFDKSINTLIVGKTSYKTRGFRLQLIALLFNNEKTKAKHWQLDQLFDQLEGKGSKALDEYPRFSKKLYSACDGINKQIGLKGVKDFLIFTKSTAKLNPKYL